LVNTVAAADVDAAWLELVDAGAGDGVNGACCGTLTFEMLRLNVTSGPVYVQWICVIPHVIISPACGKTNDGEDDGVAVAEGAADMMDKRRWGSAGLQCCKKKTIEK
jgi:hypothetical protein